MEVLKKLQQVVYCINKQNNCNWLFIVSIQQINFTGNLARAAGATMFFIIEETKEAVLDFS